MRMRPLLFVLLVASARPASAQPRIDLPPPEEQPTTGLPRESPIENPLGRAPVGTGSAIGGYGELALSIPDRAPAEVDLRRVVLYFGHSFGELDNRLRFYS